MYLSEVNFREELFYSKIERVSSGCWEWRGRIKSAGNERKGGGKRGRYGQFSVYYPKRPKGKQKGNMDAHRLMWLLVNGYVGPKEIICHKCNNKECVNPDHLYSGTQKQNVKDSIDARTHVSTTWSNFCPQGHEYTQENTYIALGKNGYDYRTCRECHRTRQREYSRKKSMQTASEAE